MSSITVRLNNVNGVVFAECPVLPGCFAQGENEVEALDNLLIAMNTWLEDYNCNICKKIEKKPEQQDILVSVNFTLHEDETKTGE